MVTMCHWALTAKPPDWCFCIIRSHIACMERSTSPWLHKSLTVIAGHLPTSSQSLPLSSKKKKTDSLFNGCDGICGLVISRQQHGSDFRWHVLLIWFWWDVTGVCSSAGIIALICEMTSPLSSVCLLHPFPFVSRLQASSECLSLQQQGMREWRAGKAGGWRAVPGGNQHCLH